MTRAYNLITSINVLLCVSNSIIGITLLPFFFQSLGKHFSLFFFSQAKPSISSILSTFLQEPNPRSALLLLSIIYFLSYSHSLLLLDPRLWYRHHNPLLVAQAEHLTIHLCPLPLLYSFMVTKSPWFFPCCLPGFSLLAHFTIILAINLPSFITTSLPFWSCPFSLHILHPWRTLSSPCMAGSIYPWEQDLSRCLII